MNSPEKREMSEKLAERLARYGAATVTATAQLPETREGRHIRDQLLRSGTAPGAHYAEARGAQSRADFVHKLALALKELRESQHWFQVAAYAGFLPTLARDPVSDEGLALAATLTRSLQTARRNRGDFKEG